MFTQGSCSLTGKVKQTSCIYDYKLKIEQSLNSNEMAEVKLIGTSASLFSRRIEWALKLKGVDYEFLQEDLLNKSPDLLKYNPVHKKVPVLVTEDDKPIVESLVILEYIDEKWNHNALLPSEPHQRAMARFWAKYADEKCVVESFNAAWKEGGEKEKAIERAKESLGFIEEQIKGKKYFNGEKIGYLDLVLGWIPLWLSVMEQVGEMKLIDSERFPSLCEWSRSFVENPVIKECLPTRDMLVDYFTGSIA